MVIVKPVRLPLASTFAMPVAPVPPPPVMLTSGAAKKPEENAPPQSPPPTQTTPEDGVPRIAPAEAHDAFEKGKAIIVDVRSESSYRVGHIQGALWMPDVASRTKELPRDKMIITYCS